MRNEENVQATFHDMLEFVIGGDAARHHEEQVTLEVRVKWTPCCVSGDRVDGEACYGHQRGQAGSPAMLHAPTAG